MNIMNVQCDSRGKLSLKIHEVMKLGKFKRIRTGKNRTKIKCNKCNSIFYERYHKDENGTYYCPSCKASGKLPEDFTLVELPSSKNS
ncbi:MAG: hypothetical protein EAX96_03435 [Candidatus Lokiarchaeota archaeon]|nr:hypothetical protein [Candidatus Lokiarchaeota archaeon]